LSQLRNGNGTYANTYTGQALETRGDLSSHANFRSSNHGHFYPSQSQSKNSTLPTTTLPESCKVLCVSGVRDVVQSEGWEGGWRRVLSHAEVCMVLSFGVGVCEKDVTQ